MNLRSKFLRCGLFTAIYITLVLAACGGEPADEIVSVDYDYKTFYKETEECVSPDSSCAHIILEYPLFTSAPTESMVQALNYTIESMVLSCALDPEEVDSIPDVIEQFLSEYNQAREEFDDYWVAWNQQISIDIKGDTSGIMCLALSRYEYTGGAHPNSELTYHNLDTRTGKSVAFEDVLIPGMEDSVRILAEREFREVHQLKPDEDLGQAGFWFEEGFTLTNNICIGEDGITFFYNPYEIAPYAAGPTEIYLTYEELEGVVDVRRRLGRS